MDTRLIFLDIDGTFIEPGRMEAPASAVEAVRAARANGHKVFLCTGRNYKMTAPVLHYGFDGYVCSAGGYVVCGQDVLFDCPMDKAQSDGVRALLKPTGWSAPWKPKRHLRRRTDDPAAVQLPGPAGRRAEQ